jgi:hypothetical protein
MPITFACGCGKKLRVPDQHAGTKTRCPDCHKTLTIPEPHPPPPAPVGETFGLAPAEPVKRPKQQIIIQKSMQPRCPQCGLPAEVADEPCDRCAGKLAGKAAKRQAERDAERRAKWEPDRTQRDLFRAFTAPGRQTLRVLVVGFVSIVLTAVAVALFRR